MIRRFRFSLGLVVLILLVRSAAAQQLQWTRPTFAELKAGLRSGQPQAQELAVTVAYLGLGEEVPIPELEAWFAELTEKQDPLRTALFAAGCLAPARISASRSLSGRSESAYLQAIRLAWEPLLFGDAEPYGDLLFERLRPHIGKREAQFLITGLQEGTIPNRSRAVGFLMGARFSQVQELLPVYILDESQPPEERVRLLEKLLQGAGRDGLDKLRPLFEESTSDIMLRRLLVSWQSFLTADDLPILQEIADRDVGTASVFALQLWARNEQETAKRIEILDRILEAEPGFRATTLDSLARAGLDAAIGQRLLELLDSPQSENQRLAVRMLPRFFPSETLYAEYLRRMDPKASPRSRGRWMAEISRLPIADAKQAAAEWLNEEGWDTGSVGLLVSRNLYKNPEVDAILAGFLNRHEIPEAVRFPLAVARAPFSEEARIYLRAALDSDNGMRQEQAVRALARAGQEEDHQRLLQLIQDDFYSSFARASAVRGLAGIVDALLPLFEPPFADKSYLDYAVGEALVQTLVKHPDPEIRSHGWEFAYGGFDWKDIEERRSLLLAAFQAIEANPIAAETSNAALQLRKRMQELSFASTLETLTSCESDPRKLNSQYALVGTASRALAACLRAGGNLGDELLDVSLQQVPAGAVILSASLLAEDYSEIAANWAQQLANRQGLQTPARIWALAVWSRAAYAGDLRDYPLALENLLARPQELWSHPWELATGLANPHSRGWVLPVDRLQENYLFASAVDHAEDRLHLLGRLVGGYVAPAILIDACGLLLDSRQRSGDYVDLAVLLAKQAVDWAPAEVNAHLALAEALTQSEEPVGQKEALLRRSYQEVLRLAPDGSGSQQKAQEALRRLDNAER